MKFIVVAMMLIVSCVGFESAYEQVQDVHIRQGGTTRLMGQGAGAGSITCDSGVVSHSSFGAVTSQEISILTNLPGTYRYTGVVVSETIQFSGGSGTGLTVSMGRPGPTTNAEMFPNLTLMVSGSDANFQSDIPGPPLVVPATGAYSIVLNFIGDGTHLLNTYTAGSVTWEACHYVGATR